MQRMKLLIIVMMLRFIFQPANVCAQQLLHADSMMYGDTTRKYVVYKPEGEPGLEGYPLVIGLHGTSSNGIGFMATASLVGKADDENFLAVCPDALKNGIYTYFNAGGGYEELTGGTDDIGFISALIDSMVKNFSVDTTRVYVIGHSNGAMTAYRMAAELPHKIAAIGANAGTMLLDFCDAEYPVPIIHVHGLSDPLVPYEGGTTIIYYPPVDSTLGIWRGTNGCSPIPETIFEDTGIIGKKWTSLSGRGDIILYTIEDMPHKWSRADTNSYGLATTDVMWDFLKLQQRSSEQLIEEKQLFHDTVRTYLVYEPELDPNPDGYPLVIGFHGGGAMSKGYSFFGTAGLIPKAKIEKFIAVCPNSLTFGIPFWNAGSGYEQITNGTDDVGFISSMIDSMIKNYNIDTTRIYLMGHSNGSMMAYRTAAELSERIAGLAVNTGQMVYEYCNPESPVPILHFHGLDDDKCAYGGAADEDSLLIIPPVETVMEIWRGFNNCSSIPDTILNDGRILGRRWNSLAGNGDVILYRIEDWGHSWPRSGDPGINAADIMWDFLKDQQKGSAANIEVKRFTFNGEMRTYLVYAPSPNPGSRPLLIGMHCHTGTASGLLSYTDLLQKVKDENIVGVFPNGLRHPIGTAWNAGSSFEQFTLGTDDVGFISALIDTMIKNYDIDSTRIYASGHSNGSMMSYRLAAELSHRIAAVGGVAAPMVYEYCDPEYPVPIVHFHGLGDTTYPYQGKVKDFITLPHVDSVLAMWIEANDCSSIPDTILNDNGTIGQKWASADGRGDILLYTIESCMHDWPVLDNYNIAATDVIWDYMEQHSRILTSIKSAGNEMLPVSSRLFQNYPNPFNPWTKIKYQLRNAGRTIIKVYNTAGQEIETLINKHQPAGEYEINWQPKGLSSGIYFYRLKSGKYIKTKKLILLK